jgi:hypothetical protein
MFLDFDEDEGGLEIGNLAAGDQATDDSGPGAIT